MVNPTIVSLAFIKTNWDLHQKGYLDNFIPIIADSMKYLVQDIIVLQELQDTIEHQFGLKIPQNAIESILKRAKKNHYVIVEQNVYKRNNEKLAELDFRTVRQSVIEKHEKLVSALIDYCERVWHIKWSQSDAENALQFYLQDNELSIVTATTFGTTIPMALPPAKNVKYFVGSFIQSLKDNDSSVLEYLDTVVKGNMLANAIFLPDPNQAGKKFRHTEVYFDTTFLIYALGYAGTARKEPCTELLELLYESGAQLRCFRHTLAETKNVIDSIAKRMSRGEHIEGHGPGIPSVEYFLSEGFTASDLELLLVKLEKDLENLRIKVVDKPEYEAKYNIDEQALDTTFKKIGYRNDRARQRDVDSIAAIMRLRRANNQSLLEDCKAVFVTSNTALAKQCVNHFCKMDQRIAITPCLTDYTITNILWLKKPMASPDLPRKRIIADCYAATQPDDNMWRKYIGEIEKLSSEGTVSADDYYLLRYSLEAKQSLMELTQGDIATFSRGTIKEILDMIRQGIKQEFTEDLRVAKERADNAESEREKTSRELTDEYTTRLIEEKGRTTNANTEIAKRKTKEAERDGRLQNKSVNIAKIIINTIVALISLGLVVGSILSIISGLGKNNGTWGWFVLFTIQVVVLLLSIINFTWGTTLKTYSRRLESRLSNWIYSKLNDLFS